MNLKKNVKKWTKQNRRLLVAIVFMLIAVLMVTLGNFTYKTSFFFISTGESKFNIAPNYMSILCAIIIYMGSIVRNKREMFKTSQSTVMCVLNVIFIACLLETFINENFNLFGFTAWSIIILAIVLSWVGVKAISGYAWMVILFGAVTQVPKANEAMGLWGAAFLICAFISIGNQLYSGFLVVNTEELKDEILGSKETISENVNASIDATKKTINNFKSMASPKITKAVKNDNKQINIKESL